MNTNFKTHTFQNELGLTLGCKLFGRLAGSIILISGLFLFSSCEEKGIEEKLDEELPRITLEKFSLTETKTGDKLWTLDAEQARVYDEIIKVDSVKIRFYDKDQIEFSILYAPGGILNRKTHNILVGDSVAVFTNDSTKLFTDSLFWQNDSQKILTDCYVKIIKQDGTVIEGKGLRADPYLKKIEVIGETKGISPIELPDIRK
ncbi:LPS export ABC transporter periplasmic protein LptC [candidate division WOR-3 bacterium]|nr:LPS export ABC transporter periplasmic protein LptC [candidate division WOR-3 bacterium]